MTESTAQLTFPQLSENRPPIQNLISQLKGLILCRVLLNTFLIVAMFWLKKYTEESERFKFMDDADPERVYTYQFYVCMTVYALSFIYAFALRILKSRRYLLIFTYGQFVGDIMYAASIVFLTGGTDSVFTFTFLLIILAAAIIFFRPGALYTASICTAVLTIIALVELNMLPYGDLLHEYRMAFIPGAAGWVEDRLFPVSVNVGLNVMAFFGVALLASWLSEQVKRGALRAREQQHSFEDLKALHQNIVNSLLTGLITIDRQRKIRFINGIAQQITTYKPEHVLGQDVIEFFRNLKHILANPHKGQALQFEETLQILGKREVYLRWSISLLRDAQNQVIGHILMFQDVTHIKAMERNVQRTENMAAIGEVAAAIAHEIRNPLAAIFGSVQLLSQLEHLDEDDKRLMSIVLRETENLNLWINDFLAYSRPTPFERDSVDLTAIVDDTLIMFRQDEDLPNVSINRTGTDNALIWGDQTRLKQVIWNLLKNAAQSMPGGGDIQVDISGNNSGVRRFLQLAVTDCGEGIPPDRVDKVFQPFFTTKDGGTGLGLAIVHRIVEDHEAEISVESEVGKGTTFRVKFPDVRHDAGVANA
jgi:two-component system sensor histidine kinase PilS (NtrC family)